MLGFSYSQGQGQPRNLSRGEGPNTVHGTSRQRPDQPVYVSRPSLTVPAFPKLSSTILRHATSLVERPVLSGVYFPSAFESPDTSHLSCVAPEYTLLDICAASTRCSRSKEAVKVFPEPDSPANMMTWWRPRPWPWPIAQ